MDLSKALMIAAAGMKAQGTRLRVVAENLANAETTAPSPDMLPYRRRVVTFRNELDRELGVDLVGVDGINVDSSDFRREYQPGHPSADADGYVLMPNVNSLIEIMDMREAQRSYEANVKSIEASKSMLMKTVEILRG